MAQSPPQASHSLPAPMSGVAALGTSPQSTMPALPQSQMQQYQPHPPSSQTLGFTPPGPGYYGPQSGQIVMTSFGPMAWLPTNGPPPSQGGGNAPIGLESVASHAQSSEAGEEESARELRPSVSEEAEQGRMDTFLEGFRVGVEATKKVSGTSIAEVKSCSSPMHFM